ncbi:SRPBCC domain-containing protein [Streptomyces sp. NPDC001339]|uniref:SRPBCC domain-containing protein n=1 Tax=Streptomyces sp. NPDC001339 TaxID=3364563 RepID=UPI0036CF8DA7
MEHEVYVPFPVGTVRQALAEPERVARCVPGVQLDADAAPHCPEGRLRLRIGSSTITYRGSLTVSDATDSEVTVEAKGIEARGDGSVALTLTVRLSPATAPGPGTALVCAGTVHSDGRLAEAPHQSAETAGRRLLDRFAENLADDLRAQPPTTGSTGSTEPTEPIDLTAPTEPTEPTEPAVFGTDVPSPSLDPLSDEDAYGAAAYGGDADGDAPAEAAHARRTMIGRSAEEVDHAPPRGRYAPVPAPQTASTSAALRWAAPAAAVVLASAVVVGRVLRRRR